MIFPENGIEKKYCPEGAAFLFIAKFGERIVAVRDQFPRAVSIDRRWEENAAWLWLMETMGCHIVTGVLVAENPDKFSVWERKNEKKVESKR